MATKLPLPLMLLLATVAGCGQEAQPVELVFSGPAMGAGYNVTVVGEDTAAAKRAISAAILGVLADVDVKMSTYRLDSEISRFNVSESTQTFPLAAETMEVLAISRAVSVASAGAFDVTVAPLVEAWGFGGKHGPPALLPTDDQLARLGAQVGYEKLELAADGSGARKLHPALTLDLDAVAPGYAVDEIVEALAGLGFERAMVEVGGEVRAVGLSASGDPWRIGVEAPEPGVRKVHRVLPLRDLALATSGDYRAFYERDGQRYSHTIDPRTARPVAHAGASVSVVTLTCAEADAWATALMVLGPEEGLRVAEAQGLAALFLAHQADGGFAESWSPRFEALFRPSPRLQ